MEKVYIKFTRPTIAQKKAMDRGETMELPRNEAQYLVNLGKAKLIEVEKSSYEKRTSKKKA